MSKSTIERSKIVVEAINGTIYLAIWKYNPNAWIYLKPSVFETLMRNDGKERFYRVRQHIGIDSVSPGRLRSGVLGRWCSRRGVFEMAHGAPGEPISNVDDAVRIDSFFVHVGEIKKFRTLMEISRNNSDGLRKVKGGYFSLI